MFLTSDVSLSLSLPSTLFLKLINIPLGEDWEKKKKEKSQLQKQLSPYRVHGSRTSKNLERSPASPGLSTLHSSSRGGGGDDGGGAKCPSLKPCPSLKQCPSLNALCWGETPEKRARARPLLAGAPAKFPQVGAGRNPASGGQPRSLQKEPK